MNTNAFEHQKSFREIELKQSTEIVNDEGNGNLISFVFSSNKTKMKKKITRICIFKRYLRIGTFKYIY